MQESLLLEPMFDAPGSNIRAVHIDEHVVQGTKKADYVMVPDEEEHVAAETSDAFHDEEEVYAGDATFRA